MTGQKIAYGALSAATRKWYVDQMIRELQTPLWFTQFAAEPKPPSLWWRIRYRLWLRHWWRFTDWLCSKICGCDRCS